MESAAAWDDAMRCVDKCFVDLQPLAWLARHMYNLGAVASLLSMLKVRPPSRVPRSQPLL